jgi:c-di-GMP-binding flagellar brake protein YcgR
MTSGVVDMAILRSVWQKLSGKPLAAKTAPEPKIASVTPIAKPKRDIPAKYLALAALLDQRQLIEVKVGTSSLAYQTQVVALDIKRGLLWLDDLFPSQHMLEIGDQITLRHHRNGEQLSFSAPILAWGSQYGANGLAILLPEQADYLPRRQFRRADMRDKPSLSLKLRALGQDVCYASVLDISSGGLRASITGNLLGQLRHGALLPLCELSLSDELTLRCSARLRSFCLLRTPHRHTQISIEFVDLASESKQQLQQFINNLIYLQQPEAMLQLRSA